MPRLLRVLTTLLVLVAPALAAGDLSVAMGAAGSDVAINSAASR